MISARTDSARSLMPCRLRQTWATAAFPVASRCETCQGITNRSRGRSWRMANPGFDEAVRADLVRRLMAARRAVRDAKQSADRKAEAAAHKAVDEVKRAFPPGRMMNAESRHLRSRRDPSGLGRSSRARLARSDGEVRPRRELRTGREARSARAATSSFPCSCRPTNSETTARKWRNGAATASRRSTCRWCVRSPRSPICFDACAMPASGSPLRPRPRRMNSTSTSTSRASPTWSR